MITLGGVSYYRHGHVYYRRVVRDGRWVYVEIAPPVGVVVAQLPPSPNRVIINGQVYYRSGTTFYVPSTPPRLQSAVPAGVPVDSAANTAQYIVTKPPVGAVVPSLPQGATTFKAGTTTYYQSGDSYYLPIQIGEQTQYAVVERPAGVAQRENATRQF